MNTTTIKERLILMSGPMVRAIRAGTKTQTRRVAKDVKHPDGGNTYAPSELAREPGHVIQFTCPYGKPGDRLRVKEHAWMWCEQRPNGVTKTGRPKFLHVPLREAQVFYCADHPQKPALDVVSPSTGNAWGWRKKLGRFLPAWASRLTLEIVSVRVERLQDISKADAAAEGVNWRDCPLYQTPAQMERMHRGQGCSQSVDYIGGYRKLWESINGPGSWVLNPWVWVVSFKRVK